MVQAATVSAGDVLAGKYRVERVLGVGGMGVVVAATHLALDQRVALKFMLPEVLSNPDHVSRFLREARSVVRLKSEHVARVLDVGTLDNGAPYIVMEYLDGIDLGGYFVQRGPMTANEAADLILQACEAIAEAHALGIVHRDLKPANLFLTHGADGNALVKVLDFGIAKATTGELQLTRTQSVMGSPGYMSPEQMRSSRTTDARSDIWSIGVILYQMVTGTVPFDAETFTELVVRVTTEPPTPLPANRLPPAFAAAINRCLEKDPNRRYQHIGELALALAPFASPRIAPIVEKITGILRPSLQLIPSTGPHAKTTLGHSTGSGKRGQRTLIITGVAAVVLTAAGVIAIVAMKQQETAAPNPVEESPAAAKPAPTPPPPAVVPAPQPEPAPSPAVAPAPQPEPPPAPVAATPPEPAKPPVAAKQDPEPEPAKAPAKKRPAKKKPATTETKPRDLLESAD